MLRLTILTMALALGLTMAGTGRANASGRERSERTRCSGPAPVRPPSGRERSERTRCSGPAPVRPPAGAAPEVGSAKKLQRQGRALMKKGALDQACPKLARSLALRPATGATIDLAECEARSGRPASAWRRLRTAAAQLPPRDRRRATVLKRAAALRKRVPFLVIRVADLPPGSEVRRDDMVLAAAALAVPAALDPGPHVITVTAPGRQASRTEISLAVGQEKAVVITAGAPLPAPPLPVATLPLPGSGPGATVGVASSPGPTVSRRRALLGYSMVGLGAAGLGTSAYFLVRTLVGLGDANGVALREGERSSALISVASLTVGALATQVGIGILRGGHLGESSATALVVPQPDGATVQLAGRF